jgi:hypothetical protein
MIAASAGISRFFIQNTLLIIGPLRGMTVRLRGKEASTKAKKIVGRTAHWSGRLVHPALGGKQIPIPIAPVSSESVAHGVV